MRFHAKNVSVGESGDEYFAVSFDSEAPSDDDSDRSRHENPYLIVQQQFEDDDGGVCYIETHDHDTYTGHFRLRLIGLTPTRFAFEIARNDHKYVEVTYDLESGRRYRKKSVVRLTLLASYPAAAAVVRAGGPMRSNSVPKGMLPIYERIVGLTDDACDRQLNSEYRDFGARNDRGTVQEAPEPTHFWTTANLGGRDRLRSEKDQLSRRPFVSSVDDNGRSMRRIRSRGEHRPRQGACHREDPQDRGI